MTTYEFKLRDRWVHEKAPAYHFWMLCFKSRSLLKFLVWNVIDKVLFWACLRLNKEWRLPKVFSLGFPPVGVIGLWDDRVILDPRGWLVDLFWKRSFDKHYGALEDVA